MKLHAALIMSCLSCISQTAPAKPPCDTRLTFALLTLPDPVNAYRPNYCQNSAGYELHAARIPSPAFGYNRIKTSTSPIPGRNRWAAGAGVAVALTAPTTQ